MYNPRDPWQGKQAEIQAYMQNLAANDPTEEWNASDLANEVAGIYNLWTQPYDKNEPYPIEVLEYALTLIPE